MDLFETFLTIIALFFLAITLVELSEVGRKNAKKIKREDEK